jgi:hypothetical protein
MIMRLLEKKCKQEIQKADGTPNNSKLMQKTTPTYKMNITLLLLGLKTFLEK